MRNEVKRFFAARAWIAGAWANNVLLGVDDDGLWCRVEADSPPPDAAAVTVLDGPLLPGLVDAHSHAFQRAIAGLSDRRGGAAARGDDFWSWRDRMYSVALRITPDQLESIAALLYAELLAGGYTQVCEFHYLHHAADAQSATRPHADPLEMSLALVRAAQRVGIGLTLLPALYMRSGFGAAGLRDDQRRFASTPDSVRRLVDGVQAQAGALRNINVGVAVHSLRAADAAAIAEVAAFAAERRLPVHLHIAEQTREVEDCVAHTGQRPIAWLLDRLPVDSRWNLVHATHANAAELQAVAASGASIVICPSTEANLGDGVFDFSRYAAIGGRWSIGSDSHVTRRWSEELRLLEYGQRLVHRRRNVAAQAGAFESSGAALFEAALAGGQTATGRSQGAIEVGRRADFVVLDRQSAALLGVPAEQLLDTLVFSSPDARFKDVFVAGRQRVADGRLVASDLVENAVSNSVSGSVCEAWPALAEDFVRTMSSLWG